MESLLVLISAVHAGISAFFDSVLSCFFPGKAGFCALVYGLSVELLLERSLFDSLNWRAWGYPPTEQWKEWRILGSLCRGGLWQCVSGNSELLAR